MRLRICQCRGVLASPAYGHTIHMALAALTADNLPLLGAETETWEPGTAQSLQSFINSASPVARTFSVQCNQSYGTGLQERPYPHHTHLEPGSSVTYEPHVSGIEATAILPAGGGAVYAASAVASQMTLDGVGAGAAVANGTTSPVETLAEMHGKAFGFRTWATVPPAPQFGPDSPIGRNVRVIGRYAPSNVVPPTANPFAHVFGRYTILNHSIVSGFRHLLSAHRWEVVPSDGAFGAVELINPGTAASEFGVPRNSIATADGDHASRFILDYGSPFPTIEIRRFGMQAFYRPQSSWDGGSMQFVPDGCLIAPGVGLGLYQYMPEGFWHHRSGYANNLGLYCSAARFGLPANHMPQHINLVRL